MVGKGLGVGKVEEEPGGGSIWPRVSELRGRVRAGEGEEGKSGEDFCLLLLLLVEASGR